MCDYSLESFYSRTAVVGEKYTLRRFRTGSMGFIAGSDCETAICMPAGARLHLEGLNELVQHAFEVGPAEEVVMIRLPFRTSMHCDAVRFGNGREVLLQCLNSGICATLTARNLAKVLDLHERAKSDLVDA